MRTIIFLKKCLIFKNNRIIKSCNYSTKSLGLWKNEFDNSLRHKIEEHWKPKLKRFQYSEDDTRPKYYVLSMFPYPSGNLHMGHVRVYTISDSIARFHRMLGKNVFQPMGWDAFGLPAENAALERNESPKDWTYKNIKTMKNQLLDLACSFDWDRELSTCHPGYYKFTQYIFLKLYHEGFIYQKEALVNWDPVDKTVLADEQVDEQGRSWRSGAKVVKKPLKQWFIRTTRFAKSLLESLEDPSLQDWKDIINIQKGWIGDCSGTVFDFQVVGVNKIDKIILTVWTNKAEHVSRAKFIAVATGSLLDKLCEGEHNRQLNCKAINPVTGEQLPIFVTNVIEYEEGSDCRLGIPDVFECDYVFAEQNKISVGVREHFLEDNEEERFRICKEAMLKNYGGYPTSVNLRDWLISRQRYWGTPIPIVNCKNCGVQPVNFEDLPVLLPSVNLKEQSETTCPKCKGIAERETDTMDTFVDSSWYYLRYIDPRNDVEPFNKELVNKLYPVDVYVGGKEHAVLHLYYARFMAHFLHSIGWIKEKEPFKRMLVQGMVMGKTYRVKGSGKYLKQDEVVQKGKTLVEKETGTPVVEQWEKMSKSKYNGVEPSYILTKYGIDTTRLLILADVSPMSNRHWNEKTFPGILKWQHRLWLTIKEFIEARSVQSDIKKSAKFDEQEEYLWDSRNYYLKGAFYNYSNTHMLSVAISKMQGLTGSLRKSSKDVIALGGEYERALVTQVIMLAPVAPHFASELWAGIQDAPGRINKIPNEIKWNISLDEQLWPQVDLDYKLEVYLLVNNAVKNIMKLPRREFELLNVDNAKSLALSDATVQKVLAGSLVRDVKFELFPSYGANINLLTELRRHKNVIEDADVV
ncbi:leucyl-tRNA synthetase, mitochondrial [Lycorma delicatula]|uniref:leucyl-tRNA synthetase, mitochondrial n=1 Tax=Lycorma delicatula TaxID=130591 RepID=UPI003F50EE38